SSTKANMHTVQLAAEDYCIQNSGVYASDFASVAASLPSAFRNPFNGGAGPSVAWEDRGSVLTAVTSTPGLASYADSLTTSYNVKGYGSSSAFGLVLSSGP